MTCRHCNNNSNFEEHKYNCNCGHPHSEHVWCGPCLRTGCICDAYSQTQQIPRVANPKQSVRLVPRLAKGANV